jgi:protein BCP1
MSPVKEHKKRKSAPPQAELAQDDQVDVRNEEDDDSDDEEPEGMEDEEGSESEDDFINQNIDVEFEAYEPIESDFNGIRKLINRCLLKEDVNISELTDEIIAQKNITLVIKQSLGDDDVEIEEDDDDDLDEVYGVTSLLDLNSAKKSIDQLNKYLIENSKASQDSTVLALLENKDKKRMALVVSERFVNLSPQLCLPAYESLIKEIKKDESLNFEYYVMIAKILKPKQNKRKKGNSSRAQGLPETIFTNAEEEIFDQKADHKFEFSVASQCDGDQRGGDWDEDDQQYVPFRRVMVFTKKNFFAVAANLKNEIN